MTERPGVSGSAVLRDVRKGMSRPQKELSPKYFYDRRGSELFEEITELPEYYLTRAERALLEQHVPRWVREIGPRTLVELGAGSALKTRIILDAMESVGTGAVYAPVDISEEFLSETARLLRSQYRDLQVVPVVADISERIELPADLPRPALIAFLGSTIGNFPPDQAVDLLRQVCAGMEERDRFLLGVDLRKDPEVIEAAYNDSRGVTAEFNLNILRVLNEETGADFDPASFRHQAFYDRALHRIEMHLVSTRDQVVHVPGAGRWQVRANESIRTEISCKHDRGSVEAMLDRAGLEVTAWTVADGGLYALALAARIPG